MGRYPYTSFLGGLTNEDETFISAALKNVGFTSQLSNTSSSFCDTPFNAHSDGEKQRILIAKAIAQQTPIILLNEPTAHLDLPNRIKVLQLLRRLAHEQGKNHSYFHARTRTCYPTIRPNPTDVQAWYYA